MRFFTKQAEQTKDLEKAFWVDCEKITKEEAKQLQKRFSLHPVTVDDLLSKNSRVKIEEFPEYLVCVFYGLSKDNTPVEVDFIIGKDFLITNRAKSLGIIKPLSHDEEKLKMLIKGGNDFLMYKILDEMVDQCFEVLGKTAELTEKLEEQVARNPTQQLLSQIFTVKSQLSKVKRLFLAQREKMGWLAKTPTSFLQKETIPYFRDVYDHSVQLSDTLEGYREDVVNAFEVYMSSMSNNMNQVMKVLSIIATITLPLTVISGIYGTNFLNLPGMEAYYGFWYMLLGMLLLSITMIFLFKRKNWL